MPLRTQGGSGDHDKHDHDDPGPGRHVPFWLHQLVEYLLAAALLWAGARVEGDGRIVAFSLGGALLVFSAISDGGFGAGRVLSRSQHRIGDLVLVVAIPVVLVAVPGARTAVVLVPGGASVAMLVYLLRRTRYERRPPRARPAVPMLARRVSRTSPVSRLPRPSGAPDGSPVARRVGRALSGDGTPVARRAGRALSGDGSPVARRAGRLLGRTARRSASRPRGDG